MYMRNKNLLDDFSFTRNLSPSTIKLYESAIKQYTKFCNKDMESLIIEAEEDEEQRKLWKNRRIKKRLMKFRVFLFKNYLEKTAKMYFQLILTVYRHYDVELQRLPNISDKNTNKSEPIQYSDLPDKQIIEKALNIANIRSRAIIFFMVSTGCARMETSNITINQYVEATDNYHDSDNIYDVLDELKNRDDVVPTFRICRQKTKKFYITFCTPEAVDSINNYLVSYSQKLNGEDKLFHASPRYINYVFATLNERLMLGKKGSFNRFRPHMIRKFNASCLHNDGMSIDYIDALQGRVRSSVHQSYFFDNPEKLKEEYIEHMGAVTIEWNCRNLTFKSKEFLELEKDNVEKTKMLSDVVNRLEEVESYVFSDFSRKEMEDMRKFV